jgi:GNAT superfamily N-acetyltransferase
MQIRPANASDDLAPIQALEKAARSRYLDIPDLAFVAASPPIALERLRTVELIVAEEGERIVGIVLTNPMDGGLYIANISVAAGYSGLGIGAALMNAALQHAASRDLLKVMLTTFRAPKWNGAWFRRFGFSPMTQEQIGAGLRAVLERQAAFVDPSTRETLWWRLSDK